MLKAKMPWRIIGADVEVPAVHIDSNLKPKGILVMGNLVGATNSAICILKDSLRIYQVSESLIFKVFC